MTRRTLFAAGYPEIAYGRCVVCQIYDATSVLSIPKL